jgi:methylmalonyl-CoA mutase cobalamin-binding domain/chain
LWQKADSVAQAAQDEDVHWLGISSLNGTHMTLVPQVLEALRRRDLSHIGIIVGGIVPPSDQQKLKEMDVDACFGPGVSIASIVEFLVGHARKPVS